MSLCANAPRRCQARSVSVAPIRNSRIDLLRGLSIGAVLLLHFSLTYRLSDSALSLLLPASWIRAVVINGNYGVTVFFVVSGFLITSNNLARYGRLSETRLRQFYAWRFSRIVPPLVLALIVIVALAAMRVPSFADSGGNQLTEPVLFALAIGSVITFWHNVLMQHVGYFNYCLNIYWSLSVEEALCSALLLLGAFNSAQQKSIRLPTRIVAAMRDIVPKESLSPMLKLPLLALFVLLSALVAGAVARFYAEPLNRRLRLLSSLA
jgi:peptidoglycan/LPS O-acetylase OafA/YrhL